MMNSLIEKLESSFTYCDILSNMGIAVGEIDCDYAY